MLLTTLSTWSVMASYNHDAAHVILNTIYMWFHFILLKARFKGQNTEINFELPVITLFGFYCLVLNNYQKFRKNSLIKNF